jgi:hypothetical protein
LKSILFFHFIPLAKLRILSRTSLSAAAFIYGSSRGLQSFSYLCKT